MSYIGKQPVPQSLQSRQQFTGDGSTSTFITLGGVELFEDVFLNGVRLSRVDNEYSFDGTTLTITPAPANGDTVSIILRNDHSELIALPITDSQGNNVLSESGTVVTLTTDEANVGSNALVVDSSGNVGVGTSSPAQKLHVEKDGSAVATFRTSNNDSFGGIELCGKNSSGTIQPFYLQSGPSSELKFSQGIFGTERMRIDSNGNVLVGTATLNFENSNSLSLYKQFGQIRLNHSGTSNGTYYIAFAYNGSLIGSITQSTTSSVAYNTSSDYRLKQNITEITDGITRVKQLNPSRFNFIANPENTVDGFIAHEVQDIIPEAISGEKDAVNEDGSISPQGIDQSKLVPLLTAALQEAIELIESQQSQIDALTAKTQEQDLTIASLISRIESLETPAE